MNHSRLVLTAVLLPMLLISFRPYGLTQRVSQRPGPDNSSYDSSHVNPATGQRDYGIKTDGPNESTTITYKDGWTDTDDYNERDEEIEATRDANGLLMEESDYDSKDNLRFHYIRSGVSEYFFEYDDKGVLTSARRVEETATQTIYAKWDERSKSWLPDGTVLKSAKTSNSDGVITGTVSIQLTGKLIWYVTDDLAATDTFTGTVEEQPAGRTEERAHNRDILDHCTITMAGQQTSVGNHTFTSRIPSKVTGDSQTLSFELNGQVVTTAQIPVSPIPAPTVPHTPILPTGGQQGRPIQVKGRFSGVFNDHDYVTIGGTIATNLTVDPRQKIVRSANETVGLKPIKCLNQGITTMGEFRDVSVKLSAPNNNLLKGQQTTLHCEVAGLQGIKQNASLQLVNNSDVVSMSGGNTQTLTITPLDVRTGGLYSRDLTLTAVQRGSFQVTATVKLPEQRPSTGHPPVIGNGPEVQGGRAKPNIVRDLDKDGDYESCGSGCVKPVEREEGSERKIWCVTQKDCQARGTDCGCHLFGAPNKTEEDKKKPWTHKSDPFPAKLTKEADTDYTCLCVKKKP